MIVIFFLLTMILFSLYIVLKIFEIKTKTNKRIKLFINAEKSVYVKEETKNKDHIKEIVGYLRSKFNAYFGKKISSNEEQTLDKKLTQAGNPFGMTSIDFHVIKIISRIFLPIMFAIYGKLLELNFPGVFALYLIGLIISIVVPNNYINTKIKQRYKQAIKELPDFLDILTVCLEAGLGFDSALSKVISKKNGVLSTEFHICLEEIRLGKTKKEALTRVKERLDFDEFRSLINSILQAEKLGVSFVKIFRVRSQEEREKRKQRAEEQAMKAPIKMLFPLVLFIFPSIFIVLIGPAIIQLINEFGK